MIKTGQSNSVNLRKTIKKIRRKKKEKFFQSSSQNNLCSSNLGSDILISRSGQAKIDNLESCQTLIDCDFIVF
ncbi:MAG: hypothetical protein RLZZ04_499 [Cyanobacteriota bacterium]|jgi:hypothetical protein